MRGRAVFATSALAFMTTATMPAFAAGAHEKEPVPGTVVLDDRPGQWDSVRFYPVPEVTEPEARTAIAAATARAGLPNRGIRWVEPESRERAPYFELATTIGRVEGWLRWRVPGRLAALDPWHQGRVLAELPNGAVVVSGTGTARPANGAIALDGTGDVVYRLSSWRMLVLPTTALGTFAAAFLLVRLRARRVERRSLADDRKLKKLRRSVYLAVGVLVVPDLVILVTNSALDPFLGGLEWVAPSLTRHDATETVAVVAVSLLFALVAMAAAALAAYPTERRIRGLSTTSGEALRTTARALVLGLAPIGLWFTGLALRPHGVASNPLLSVAYLAALAAVISTASPLFVLPLLQAYRPEPELAGRLEGMCERFRLRVRGVRVYKGRAHRSANALFVGILPWFRFVVVSDYLLDTFPDDEIEAVMAHEIAHGKQRHLVVGLAFTALLFAFHLVPLGGLLFLLGIYVARPALSRRLECRADDFAAAHVGVDATVRALERLGQANESPRRQRRWSVLFADHPDLDHRIERLRANSALLVGQGN